MVDEIEIRIQDGDGREILGTYRAYGGVGSIIVVKLLANGRSVRRNIEREPVEEYAKPQKARKELRTNPAAMTGAPLERA